MTTFAPPQKLIFSLPQGITRLPLDMNRVTAIILGGGKGLRLYPLTGTRCKPAIDFGGRYKLIDIPISNCLHSGCKKIFVISQFLAATLNQHIFQTYRFDPFSRGSIEVLSCEQKLDKDNWFQGTADAVRQNLDYFIDTPSDYFLILSGDQLYDFDFTSLVKFAQEKDAGLVVASLPVTRKDAKRMGILQVDPHQRIINFCEKPQDDGLLNTLKCPKNAFVPYELGDREYMGSMGIYLFKRETLIKLLECDQREDFGKHLIPTQILMGNTYSYFFDGYWEDIGTIESFYKANMALTKPSPPFSCHKEERPLFSSCYNLPAARLTNTLIRNSLVCEGSLVEADELSHSIIGPRSILKQGCSVEDSYVMGNDSYSTHAKQPEPSIGEGTILKGVIVDKNVSIGNKVQLVNKKQWLEYDGEHDVCIREGIIVVKRGACIPDGYIL